jgi:hypothetical protein
MKDVEVKSELVDYAMPLMIVEKLARQIHDLCLEKRFQEARLLATNMTTESRLLQHVLQIMNENERRSYANTEESTHQ